MPNQRSNWNEATRVQMPALVHLTRIGYTIQSLRSNHIEKQMGE